MLRSRLVSKVWVGVALASALAVIPAAAQAPGVLGVDAEFVGFDDHGRGTYRVGMTLAPHDHGALVITLADLVSPPPINPFPPEATWRYAGSSATVERVVAYLAVPAYYRGDIEVLVLASDNGQVLPVPLARLKPLMRPVLNGSAVPYGLADLDRMNLRLIATQLRPSVFELRVANMKVNAVGLIGVSLRSARLELPFGTILVDLSPLHLTEAMVADENGEFRMTVILPADLAGTAIYLQAMGDSFEDSLTPWWFSNGMKIGTHTQ